MRIGAAAAPRWWGVDPHGLPDYLAHLRASGATSVELIVHHGPAARDPSSVHLDRSDWAYAVGEAARVGLHVDVHNSLDPRLRLDRWTTDRVGLETDLGPILDLLVTVEQRQAAPPAFVVHAVDLPSSSQAVTQQVLAWLVAELDRRRCGAIVCVELRAGSGRGDGRFDRDRGRLEAFVEAQSSPAIGMCWDVANDWLTAARTGRDLASPRAAPPCVRHVHLHGASGDGSLHAPLGDDTVPWAAALDLLEISGWSGSVTLEIRYRSARDLGDPWTVLAESVRRALSVRN